jgi:hypothetical protein
LLGGDKSFFYQGNLYPPSREIICRENAHDTAADNDDIGLGRQRGARVDEHKWCGHRIPPVFGQS